MDRVVLFKGAKKDFRDLLYTEGIEDDDYTPFMELIRQYNVTVRANDTSASRDVGEFDKNPIKNAIIYADDFASVTSHVITNFTNIVILGHNIENLYIQNPPKRVEYSVRVEFDDLIEEKYSDYFNPKSCDILALYNNLLDETVIGQIDAKKKTCVSLYKKASLGANSPAVLMFYGPSGVGKTELAKKISEFYKGKLTRIQFSMMQTEEAYKYIFGDEHGKPSLARDLLARESNIILIDEFDKVNPGLYNVFYQMFDEGEFEDINYHIDVSNTIFILTTNFQNEKQVAEKLGLPIYSRIDSKIKFTALTTSELKIVIKNQFQQVINKLSEEDKKIVEDFNLENKYLESVNVFKNVRLLDKFIENDIYTLIFDYKLNKIE
ncbi:ATP-dependent protease HslVU (ClpYQ) ATPase subunit [Alkalihalobacillus xiaoxiensis]|uniref:ATP-dependent protease HslVU (ClpYQ) ATPase subunit n=1 Tax=Shouchella xiaoxiensis TaxID=766895 RepID=A0ABS2SNL9_9BACI|nr:AAA family ATPase [Shouchella xiaoxiensis]MBM7837112.1 ATP-dependent protease HslVU (ClpYQ) ATPase subunit [Shouchella xiaoxiensis]